MPVEITSKKGSGKAAGSPGTSAPASKVPMKLVAVVMQTKCGTWYSRHYHYQVNVVEVEATTTLEKILQSAETGASIVSKLTRKTIKVVEVQEVQIADQKSVREIAAKFLANK